MGETESLANHFLIAMPRLADPNFFHTVTYICDHNDDGAMGIVINRPTTMHLGDVFQYMDVFASDPHITETTVYQGGPVQTERGFVLHAPLGAWEATLRVTEEIGLTASQDILTALAQGDGPEKSLVALGYAGWGAGQLESELSQNAWLSGPAEPAILFDTPAEQRWEAAAALLGVDLNLLSDETGHA